jgi:hypothetical protein
MIRLVRFACGLSLAVTAALPACSSSSDTGGNSSSLSGLPKDELLANLSDADNNVLCEAVVKTGSASSRTDCKVIGFEAVMAAPFASGPGVPNPTNADFQKICADAEAACKAAPASTVDPRQRCAGPSAWTSTCKATVGEYEACVTDLVAWEENNESMRARLVPACSNLTVADVSLCPAPPTAEPGQAPPPCPPNALESYKWTDMPASCQTLGDKCKDASTTVPQSGVDGGACNAMSNTAPTIDDTAVAEAMPTDAAGGMIVEGTYHLTSHSKYVGVGGAAGPLGSTRQQTVVLKSTGVGTYDFESVLSKDGGPDDRVNFAATLSGTTTSLDITCPAPQFFGTSGYTATPTAYTQYDAAKGQVDVYTLVP